MLPREKLARINELAKKAKKDGLTKKEAEEQALLRREYLQQFRSSMKETIENVRVIDAKGKDVTPQKIQNIQLNKKLH